MSYARLLAAGKPKKVAIIASVRKTVMYHNSMLRDGAMWDENNAQKLVIDTIVVRYVLVTICDSFSNSRS